MKQLYYFSILLLGFILLFGVSSTAQSCDNQALAFDGNGDYISFNLNATPINGTGDFTVETQFLSNPVGGFNLLFSLTDNASSSLLTVGLIPGGLLALIWQNTSGTGPLQPILVPTNPANLEGACHHLAVTRNTNTLTLYLNGVLSATLPTFTGTFSFDEFRIGSSQAAVPGSLDWDGLVDEIRLWSIGRLASDIADTYDCVLSSNVTGMEVYWTLDPIPGGQSPTPGGINLGNLVAVDKSGHANDGALVGFNFSTSNITSNFVCNTCLPRYELLITDNPSLTPTLLPSICSGDPVHFGIYENLISVPIPGASINWEFSDDGGQNWLPVNHPLFNGTAFGLPKGVIVDPNCANSTTTTGYLDRKYRAEIVKTGPSYTCTYTTNEHDLKICCPITGNITLTPVPAFVPPASTLCEGMVTVDVVLNGPPFLSTLPIQWCVNGVLDVSLNNMTSFTYTGPANAPNLCFEAKIQNCACPPVTIKACLQVDPMPICGTIDQTFSNVVPNPGGQYSPYDYFICPGMQETLSMMSNFTNCDQVWQYHFDVPANPTWIDLSSTNNWQNTNTLPQYVPPNIPIWPTNANCIFYRIECRPPNFPNSGCPNCTSNIVRICLQPDLLTPSISASPNLICENGTSILTSVAVPNATQEQWYCNGLPFGAPMPPGSSITVSQNACYSVAVTDGCDTKFSNVECVTLCDPVAIIKCPEDNPCACFDAPITLDGTMSYSNCGPIVNYTWTIIDCTGTTTQTGPVLTYQFTAPICTASFILTVTDSNNCMETSKQLDITPCE